MPYLIGLTGNIACGKSSVGEIARRLGADYVDADSIVHELLGPGTECSARVAQRFAAFGIRRPDGGIDRRALGAVVFADPAALADLERILHPAVRQELERRQTTSNHEVFIIDAIKLIEGGLADRVDCVWVVACPRTAQLARLTTTRGLTSAEAALRIDAQGSQAEKLRRADVVIQNDGTREALEAQVTAAYRDALARARSRNREKHP